MYVIVLKYTILGILVAAISFFGGFHFGDASIRLATKVVDGGNHPEPTPQIVTFKRKRLRTMHEIGVEILSDKVVVHQYEVPYEWHFSGRREHKLKVLEIGLGCSGLADVGLGIRLWGEYFNSSHLDVMEIDKGCGEKYLREKHQARYEPEGGFALHYGDQGDTAFLENLAKTHGPWDVIIDDGSHTSEHQIKTYETLFPHLTPGGKYSIEDLQTSFWHGKWGNEGTAVHYFQNTVSRKVHTRVKKNARNGEEELDPKFRTPYRSVDCHHYVCIVTKR